MQQECMRTVDAILLLSTPVDAILLLSTPVDAISACCPSRKTTTYAMEITRRSYFPHESVVIRNLTGDPQLLRLCPELSTSGFQSTIDREQCIYDVNFASEKQVVEEAYLLKAGEAVLYVFQGSLQPPIDLPREQMLVSVSSRNLYVPPLEVKICFKFIRAIWPAISSTVDSNWWDDYRADTLTYKMSSTYTAQKLKCSFDFSVAHSKSEVDTKQCCLLHLPLYNQEIFMYYPHGIRSSSEYPNRRTCGEDCCLI